MHFAGFVFSVLLLANAAGHAVPPEDTSAVEFKRAYEAAIANAKGNDTLDPAYELLGVAGNAGARNLTDMSNGAAAAFADLVQRTTAAALNRGGLLARDTLDQLVDLRFFAETTQIERTVKVLDTAMRQLFPVATKTIEHHLDAAPIWDEKLSGLRDLMSLEASAIQVLLTDVAAPIGASFDSRVAVLEGKPPRNPTRPSKRANSARSRN